MDNISSMYQYMKWDPDAYFFSTESIWILLRMSIEHVG